MQTPPIRITADEINCLIYSYFKDSGFAHSAFTLCSEGALQTSPWFHKHIPRGELVDLLGKALLYLEVESHWRNDELVANCKNKFSLLEHHVCSTEPTTSLQSPVAPSATSSLLPSSKAPTVPSEKDASTPQGPQNLPISRESFYGTALGLQANGILAANDAPSKRKVSPIQIGGPAEKRAKREPDDMNVDAPVNGTTRIFNKVTSIQSHYLPIPPASSRAVSSRTGQSGNITNHADSRTQRTLPFVDDCVNSKAIMMLPGHRTEVFVCSFNPVKHAQLASGSKDAVVNFWELPEPPVREGEFATWSGHPKTVDNHLAGLPGDLTALNWNSEGTLLAVGSYDTVLRVLASDGSPYFLQNQHQGPIFSVRFSPNGKWLLSASLDATTCLYEVKERRLVRQYRCHQDCCLDTEWLNDTTFVTAGADGYIYVLKTDGSEPIKRFSGHTDEINQLKCNPSRTRLASCSDDNTARIWNVDRIEAESDESIPGLAASDQVVVLTGHTHSVSMIGWLPNHEAGTTEIAATSSFDCTVRVWDTTTGRCLKVLFDHQRPVYALTFSPDGKWLATGSGDGWLHIYCVKTWKKRWSWHAGANKPGLFEIAWQMVSGVNRLAVALECHKVAIIDVSKISVLQWPELEVNGDAHDIS